MNTKKLILWLLPCIVVAALVAACTEEKDDYVRPSFGAMTQEPNPAEAGPNVTLTFAHNEKGNGIAGVTYTWTVKRLVHDTETGELKDSVLTVHTNYDGYGKLDPTLTFRLPAEVTAGSYSVEMDADFQGYIGDVLYDKLPTASRDQLKVQ